MFANSLDYIHNEMQQPSTWIYEGVIFIGNQVFCPMCDIQHENNTNCQRNG